MRNPWLERRVLAYAHQGGAREGPSSTLYAMEQALSAGADALELDVHATSDGVLVVCHDPTLERTTNGAGAIATTSWAEIVQLDNAYWFVPGEDAQHGRAADAYLLRGQAPQDRRLGVARLDEVLGEFPHVPLNLDVKQGAPAVEPYEGLLAQMLERFARRDDVIVASFDDSSTAAVRELLPGIGTSPGRGLLAEAAHALLAGRRPGEEVLARLRQHVAVQVPPSFAGVRVVDARFVALAHELGLAVHVWTIDDAAEMAELVDVGVDGVITDRPSVLGRVLAEKEAVWRRPGGRGGAGIT